MPTPLKLAAKDPLVHKLLLREFKVTSVTMKFKLHQSKTINNSVTITEQDI